MDCPSSYRGLAMCLSFGWTLFWLDDEGEDGGVVCFEQRRHSSRSKVTKRPVSQRAKNWLLWPEHQAQATYERHGDRRLLLRVVGG